MSSNTFWWWVVLITNALLLPTALYPYLYYLSYHYYSITAHTYPTHCTISLPLLPLLLHYRSHLSYPLHYILTSLTTIIPLPLTPILPDTHCTISLPLLPLLLHYRLHLVPILPTALYPLPLLPILPLLLHYLSYPLHYTL